MVTSFYHKVVLCRYFSSCWIEASLPRRCAKRPNPSNPAPSYLSSNQRPCQSAVITFHMKKRFFSCCLNEAICLYGRPSAFSFARIIKKTHLYSNAPIAFPAWRHIVQATGTTWQTSQQRCLLGLIPPMFPPRNSGRLTGNRPKSPKDAISQPHPSPWVSPFPQKMAPGTSRFASFRQTISTTVHF